MNGLISLLCGLPASILLDTLDLPGSCCFYIESLRFSKKD